VPESDRENDDLRNDLRKTLGDWALRLFLNEGDRFWTRYYHCLLVNSFLTAGTAVFATSNASHFTSAGRWLAIFALSVVAACFNWLWTRVIIGGIAWHGTYGRYFHDIDKKLATQIGTDHRAIHPLGAFGSEGNGDTQQPQHKATGIMNKVLRSVYLLAVTWTVLALVSLLITVAKWCHSPGTT
jgi:hypothetical protein